MAGIKGVGEGPYHRIRGESDEKATPGKKVNAHGKELPVKGKLKRE